MVMPLPKKGDLTSDLTQCSNYRDIALLCVGYKILSYFIASSKQAGPGWPPWRTPPSALQGSFLPERSTVDQISLLRCILEHR